MTDRVVSYGKTARYKNVSRQYKVNNNIIVAFGGDHADFQWLQNVIERQGVAYQTKHVATGIAAMLLNQAVEDEWRKKGEKLTRPEAEAILRKALELTIYHDCCADNDFELGVVDAEDGVILGKQV
ncbi:hypothetical protein ANCDUO_10862 [Ancylostoma duodenale]|uniref:Proteasome subunit beta type-4 n=1 Tax=Ancylostoma duodenale TaxID=51022 RepID=A0A0C2GJ99_9BILA|nr:hypothetical protein ANCDUO_10862 [Ancylostoma duodenale]